MNKLLYDDLTNDQREWFLKYLWNGVGSNSLPLKPPAFVFSEASKYHDYSSFSGGDEQDRIEASKEFFHKAHSTIRKQPLRKRPFYYLISYIYYRVLKKVDGITWSYYERPASNWFEFIQRVKDYFYKEHQSIPDWLVGAEFIE